MFGQPIFVVGKWHAATLTAPTPTSRKLIQKHVADNDAEAFGKVMPNKTSWSSMPPDQLRRRAERLKVAVLRSGLRGLLEELLGIPSDTMATGRHL